MTARIKNGTSGNFGSRMSPLPIIHDRASKNTIGLADARDVRAPGPLFQRKYRYFS